MKKLLSIFLALAMAVGVLMPSLSKASAEEQGTKKVTVHKLLMTEDELKGWDPAEIQKKGYNGTQNLEQLKELLKNNGLNKKLEEIPKVYFAWQNEKGKWINQQGHEVDSVEDAYGMLTEANGANFDTLKLPAGKYKIVEIPEKSTYIGKNQEVLTSSKAVPVEITLPLVTEDGIVEHAHVYPKNAENKPKVEKKIDGNKDKIDKTIGEKVPYTVKTTIPKDAKYKKLRWSDIMSKGLTYNNDLKITISGTYGNVEPGHYEKTEDNNGFNLKFTLEGLKKLEETAKQSEVVITIKYSATINGEAIVNNPETNEIKLIYNNRPQKDIEPKDINPENKQIKVTKTWADEAGGKPPVGVRVVYTLIEKDTKKVVDSVVKIQNKEQDVDFNHTFKNLDASKTYQVIERISGYTPEYQTTKNGELTITNKKDTENPTPEKPESPKVYTYGKKFVKTDEGEASSGSIKSLAGAEFIVMDSNKQKYLALKDSNLKSEERKVYDEAEKDYQGEIDKYNKLTKTQQKGHEGVEAKERIKNAKEKRDKAFIKARTDFEWSNQKDKAVKYTSNEKGQFEVTGLAEGTYYLKEVKAPEGYALRSDEIPFNVNKNSYTQNGDIDYGTQQLGGKKDATQVKNKKVTIPQTGGIGTIIFTALGIVIMAGSVYAMKKRRAEEV